MTPTKDDGQLPTKVFHRAPSSTAVGLALLSRNSSASTVLSTLASAAIVAGICLPLFLYLRLRLPNLYQPRALRGTLRPEQRSPPLPQGYLNWIRPFLQVPDTHVLNTQSLDGYLLLRLLRVAVVSCVVGCLITWPILFPVNITGPGLGNQLNLLTIGHAAATLAPSSYYRYYAHTLCAYIFFPFLVLMITRETLYYINLRQAYLVSPLYANRMSSRTVLYTCIPDEYLHEPILRELLGEDVVRRVWIARHTNDLEKLVKNRDDAATKLEAAETKLVRVAAKAQRREKDQKRKTVEKQGKGTPDDSEISEDKHVAAEFSPVSRWVPKEKRPNHRLKPFIGEKVDTIEWSRGELERLIREVEVEQAAFRAGSRGKTRNCAFVEFKTLRDAQSAYQSLTHHQPLHMAPRFTGMYPEEIIWSNLGIRWWERIIRVVLSLVVVIALIIGWSAPVAFISGISRSLALNTIPALRWLSFLDNVKGWSSGFVTGLLPAVLLSLVMLILPPFLRLMARLGGDPTLSAVEYTVQNYFFWFQVIQVFLITTLTSAAWTTISAIASSPASIITVLSDGIPASSNFYVSYIVLQGLGVVVGTLLSPISLLLYLALHKLLDSTPRKMYRRWTSFNNPGLGTTYPIFSNLFVIAICYACVAPLILGFAAIGLFLFYIAFKYEFLYVFNVPYDNKGLMYARALQQLFWGIYLAQLCLIGLFATAVGAELHASLGPLILMIILLVVTVLYHISLNLATGPLLRYLPRTLETEERLLLSREGRDAPGYAGGSSGKATSAARADSTEEPGVIDLEKLALSATQVEQGRPKPTFFQKWLRPDLYSDYHILRRLVPRDVEIDYDAQTEDEAYFHPSMTSKIGMLWIPRDGGGVSAEEVRCTSRVVPITDEGARMDENGQIEWDCEDVESTVPIYRRHVYY